MQKRPARFLPSTPRLLFAIAILSLATLLGIGAWKASWVQKQVAGVALVGGPFQMVNQNGAMVTDRDFAGKPLMIFFGYTYCPDVCPTELQIMSAALDQLGAKAADVQPIFVSIDPERDTPPVIKSYLESFGPRWTGLTGSPEQVQAMARAWHVYYEKRENKESPKDYLMDHSSFVFLMGRDGKFLKHFSYTTDVNGLANGLSEALAAGG